MIEHWLDIAEYYSGKTLIDKFIFMLLYSWGEPMKIPSVRFWAITLLCTTMGMKIMMHDGHVLTEKECFTEIEDCYKDTNEFRLKRYIEQRKNLGMI